MLKRALCLLLVLLVPMLSGCGLAAQRLFAWNTSEKEKIERTHEVAVKSDPSRLEVSRVRDDAEPLPIGVTPLVDVVTYEVEETRTVHHGWLMVSIAAAELAGGMALLLAGVSDDSDVGEDPDTLRFVGLALTGGIMVNLGVADAIWGAVRLFQRDSVEETFAGDRKVTYVAKLAENARSGTVQLPDAELTIAFPKDQVAEGWVIAVMGVEDASAQSEQALSTMLLSNVSDQLRSFVAQRAKTIDRGTQDRALIQEVKKESYANCFDEACQIELGRALAATHIVRGRVTRFGGRCILNVALVDLTREVTVDAASSQGECRDESFLEMSETAARDLMKR